MAANGNFASFDVNDGAQKRDISKKLQKPIVPQGSLGRPKTKRRKGK